MRATKQVEWLPHHVRLLGSPHYVGGEIKPISIHKQTVVCQCLGMIVAKLASQSGWDSSTPQFPPMLLSRSPISASDASLPHILSEKSV